MEPEPSQLAILKTLRSASWLWGTDKKLDNNYCRHERIFINVWYIVMIIQLYSYIRVHDSCTVGLLGIIAVRACWGLFTSQHHGVHTAGHEALTLLISRFPRVKMQTHSPKGATFVCCQHRATGSSCPRSRGGGGGGRTHSARRPRPRRSQQQAPGRKYNLCSLGMVFIALLKCYIY